jgi:hypothetical protein
VADAGVVAFIIVSASRRVCFMGDGVSNKA